MPDCIFCRIVKGELPCYKLYEDDVVVSFLDIFPIKPGHALVVPKRHSADIFDTEEATMKRMIAAAKRLAPAVMKAAKADAINIGMNNREAAGQEVPHAHLHVIPRYRGDGLKSWGKSLFKDDAQKKEMCEAIRKELS